MTRATVALSVWAVLWAVPSIPAKETLSYCQKWNTKEYFRTATVESVTACLEADAAPMVRNESEETPLHVAAQYSKTPGVIETLLAAGADLKAQDAAGNTPLHAAARNENPAVIQALLAAGADPNVQTEHYWAPLHEAARNGNLEMIQALLSAGADVDLPSRGGPTALSMAVGVGNVAMIKTLLAAGADPMAFIWGSGAGGGESYTPLDVADGLALELLQAAAKKDGQDCDFWNTKRYIQGATPESVTACLEAGSNPQEKDDDGIAPLHWAAMYNENPAVIHVLIDAGANVEARDAGGRTSLRWAVNARFWDEGGNANLNVIQALLDNGANPDTRDDEGDALLHVALREITRAFNRHNRPSHYPAVIEMLLDAGADPEARDRFGRPLLHEAVGEYDIPAAVTKALLAAGANPKMRDDHGRTPLHMAAGYNGNLEVIRALLAAGSDPKARDGEGRIPLHSAAGRFGGGPEVIRALLAAGSDLEARDNERRTPLHVAAAEDQGTAEFLLEAGADMKVRDKYGNTPLHRAAAHDHSYDDRDVVAAIMALLVAGADPLARNRAGKTPWDLAQTNEKLKKSNAYRWLKAASAGAPGGDAARVSVGESRSNAAGHASGAALGEDSGQRQPRERLPYEPEMVKIPGGSFQMGCASGRGCFGSEHPVHTVRVEAFELSKYEVTFEEYDPFTAATGRDAAYDGGMGRGRKPVVFVSWEDAEAYTRWLSQQTGERYRLPSEAEWEYAARAGTETAYSWGNGLDYYQDEANCGYCTHCGICTRRNYRGTAPVGSFAPNGWGLHDMHGNMWEWVQDCWNRNYLGAPADGTAWESGDCSRRVMRGGSWADENRYVRSASRYWYSTWIRSNTTGFRVARTITP